MALMLHYEQQRGEASRFWPYVSTLPSEYPVPMNWRDDELDQLQYPPLRSEVIQMQLNPFPPSGDACARMSLATPMPIGMTPTCDQCNDHCFCHFTYMLDVQSISSCTEISSAQGSMREGMPLHHAGKEAASCMEKGARRGGDSDARDISNSRGLDVGAAGCPKPRI